MIQKKGIPMSRKWVFAYFMVACLTLIAGCWSRAELTDLAIVSAFAFDKDEEGQYVGTFQIINPGNVPGALQGGHPDKIRPSPPIQRPEPIRMNCLVRLQPRFHEGSIMHIPIFWSSARSLPEMRVYPLF
uniref:Ger(x)C family spore germination protein n=1 Tax=Paenibacillus sp. FSL W7-1279 TaxID=2921697 RepID=UPI00403FB214